MATLEQQKHKTNKQIILKNSTMMLWLSNV